ncbi:MAG: pyridoxal phosphate-dependent aminotransferase [Syntrophales bacterium]|nr:pyridoxal phosphate-dependent aminotransferase [Syntrophales bacterium]
MKLSKRIQEIKPSPTLAITMKANAMKAAGHDVIGFGAGEPDFDTPRYIKEAAVKAIEEGFTKYTPVAGIDELKDAIIDKLARDQGIKYNRSEICVSCGAKHTLYNLAQVLFEEGDEVIIPSPYWVSYIDIVKLAGATPVVVPTKEEEGFRLSPSSLLAAISERTKGIIINSPSNPTGSVYSREELKGLAEILVKSDLVVISDDIYEKILYDGLKFSSIAQVHPAMKEKTVIVNGVSKAYAMTGWRIGYAAGPEWIIQAVTKLQSQNTSNPTSIAQKAAVAALQGDQGEVEKMVQEFERRRNYICEALNSVPGFRCPKPQGAFYVFPNVEGVFGWAPKGRVINNSSDLAGYLLDEVGVAVVPGADFGDDRYLRFSYATSIDLIEKGVARIKQALS